MVIKRKKTNNKINLPLLFTFIVAGAVGHPLWNPDRCPYYSKSGAWIFVLVFRLKSVNTRNLLLNSTYDKIVVKCSRLQSTESYVNLGLLSLFQ